MIDRNRRPSALHLLSLLSLSSILLVAPACDDDKSKASGHAGAASASAAHSASATPSAAATPAATPSATPTASAAPPPDRTDCPKGSTGPGTFDHPCAAKGGARLMTAEATGKADDKGNPQFRVVNKHTATILYGKVTVYYYDKAGKLLEVKDTSGATRKHIGCGGNIFGGVMKPNEKAVVSFSCIKKDSAPEGTATTEAEISMVGFADAEGKKSEFYWKNDDLTPDDRKKGGVK
jgi:hypothetical protein